MMDLRPLVDILRCFTQIYEKNSSKSCRDFDICKQYATISRYIVVVISVVYFIVATLYQSASYLEGMLTGVWKPPTNIYFPFIDRIGICGIIVTHILNIVCNDLCGIALISFDMIIYLVVANIMLNSTVIERELIDLKITLETLDSSGCDVKEKLIAIIQMHRKYNG